MASTINAPNRIITCASCSKCETDDEKLKLCVACKMVKYCSRDCQLAHRSQHKVACKKRAGEIYDEALFKDPLAKECSICTLFMPLDGCETIKTCCWQTVCNGCEHAQFMDAIKSGKKYEDGTACPFCRAPRDNSDEATIHRVTKGMESKKADAFYLAAHYHLTGKCGFPKDMSKLTELMRKAAELGCADAYNVLGGLCLSRGEIDEKKAMHYFELAAMGGNVSVRLDLGRLHCDAGEFDRAYKHFMIGARAGHEGCLKMVKEGYERGFITKDNYSLALRSCQKQQDDRRSPMRDEAVIYNADRSLYDQHIEDTYKRMLEGSITPPAL